MPASDKKLYTQDDFSDGLFVLYLYPKDMTPGCTLESQDFRNMFLRFKKLGVKIFGLSKDPISSHQKFCEKESLPFPLLSDENVELITALDAWKEKTFYGKKYMGTDRVTFLIHNGEIVQEWKKFQVKTSGHAGDVLNAVTAFL